MLTCGFFNSVSGDRVYNADQLSSMFEGLISDGIYEDIDDAFQVKADTGMNVLVGSGRAMVNSKWVKNTAAIIKTINAAHILLNRYTAIVLRLDIGNREISVEMIDGTPSSAPQKPAIVRNNQYYDLLLAYVYVGAGVTTITQANISDQRASTYCGWVTGIIKQVNTAELFLQWETAYEEFYAQMVAWKAAEQQSYEDWYATLTEDLQVNTHIVCYTKNVSLADSDSRNIPLNMLNYEYESSDIFYVAINGLTAKQGTDYFVNTAANPPLLQVYVGGSSGQTQDIDIKILKSKIGDPVRQATTTVVGTINEDDVIPTTVTIE